MPRKSIEKEEVLDLHMRTQNRVVIKGVVGVMPCPFGLHFDRLKLRNASGKDRPDVVFPNAVIHIEVIVVRRRINV